MDLLDEHFGSHFFPNFQSINSDSIVENFPAFVFNRFRSNLCAKNKTRETLMIEMFHLDIIEFKLGHKILFSTKNVNISF